MQDREQARILRQMESVEGRFEELSIRITLPEVIADVYESQDEMRGLIRKATTVICLATMLHTIATGNMTPSFRVTEDGTVRPLYLYAVDAAEFVVNKLQDRGSLSATAIVTNVQDFITIVAKGLGVVPEGAPWG